MGFGIICQIVSPLPFPICTRMFIYSTISLFLYNTSIFFSLHLCRNLCMRPIIGWAAPNHYRRGRGHRRLRRLFSRLLPNSFRRWLHLLPLSCLSLDLLPHSGGRRLGIEPRIEMVDRVPWRGQPGAHLAYREHSETWERSVRRLGKDPLFAGDQCIVCTTCKAWAKLFGPQTKTRVLIEDQKR